MCKKLNQPSQTLRVYNSAIYISIFRICSKLLHFLQMAPLQNILKMQCTVLILTEIVISSATTDSNSFIPNRQHQQIALCIQTIAHRYFTRGRTILASMPSDEKPTGRSLSAPPNDNNRALVSFTLTKLHENVSWPLRLFPPEIPLD